jgi:lysophospholipase L1-like esterase
MTMGKTWINNNPIKILFSIIVFSVLFFVICMEVIVRLFFPNINFTGTESKLFDSTHNIFRNRKNVEAVSYGIKVFTDSDGFRIDLATTNKVLKKNKPCIMFMGDSVTFGVGVESNKIFPELLNNYLLNYNVINSSVIGYSIDTYCDIVSNFILPQQENYRIKYVILGLCLNDITTGSSEYIEKIHGEAYKTWAFFRNVYQIKAINDFLITKSKCYILIKSALRDNSKGYFFADAAQYADNQLYFAMMNKLNTISGMLREHGIGFMIVILPYEYQLRENEPNLLMPQKLLKNDLDKYQIKYIDAYLTIKTHMLKNNKISKDYFIFDDSNHFSDLGHEIIYHAIRDYLKSEGIE